MHFIKNIRLLHQSKELSPVPRSVWTDPVHFITCVFGAGCLPAMPGTWATLASILLCTTLSPLTPIAFTCIVSILCLCGIWLCGKTNRDFNTVDHPATCFDEFASFPICLIGLPITWPYLLAAFVLFRFFDIVKPPPINFLDQNLHGGMGVMLDDIVAAFFTLTLLHSAHFLLSRL